MRGGPVRPDGSVAFETVSVECQACHQVHKFPAKTKTDEQWRGEVGRWLYAHECVDK
jgi:hypothetical protein